jgi:hypothetical protein
MIDRCRNPKHPAWPHYGGRGIRACERWLVFEGFLADMGERPLGMSLDRINNDGNYEPGNCRWATWKEQGNNRRSNRRIALGGETVTAAQAAARHNVPYTLVIGRLRAGWTPELAVGEPPGKGGPAGVEQHLAKLDELSVECMRLVFALRIFDQRTIARWWGVSQPTVRQVVTGITWKHVPGPITKGRAY